MRSRIAVGALVSLFAAASVAVGAQGLRKETREGVRNMTIVDPTIACAGATEVTAIPGLAKLGYKAIINLREATEPGVAIDESRAAATAAGMKYIHLPLSNAKPDPAVPDAFLKAIADPANQPAFIHCGSGGRPAAMMMAKRMLVDGWTEARASEEATAIGLSNPTMRQFVLDYVASKKR